jgi:hypothetical protein
VATNELFVGLNDTRWSQRSGYDQNRAFVGGAWQASGKLRIEAGYMNQHINRAAMDETRGNLVLSEYVSL